MPDLRSPAGERRGDARRSARAGRLNVALATAERLPDLDPDSQLLAEPLERAGVDARPVVWSDPGVDWAAFDAVVVRSTWDYVVREEEFLAWIERAAAIVPLVNPPRVLSWNAHKTYLRELGDRGVPVVDTLWLRSGESAEVPWPRAVVKPAVSAAAIGLYRAERGERVEADRDLLVQPLVESITTEGELSLLYAGGELSHMVRKVPRAGEIRVQPEYGSEVRLETATTEHRQAAERVLAEIEEELAYARVDLVRADDGTLRLIELEVIEPQLFLGWDPASADRFATAIARAVAPRG